MRFKEWLINEMPWSMVDSTSDRQKYAISMVDIRAEDWDIIPNHPEAKRTEAIRKSLLAFWDRPDFYGQIPGDRRYLYYDSNDGKFSIVSSPPSKAICLDKLPLKHSWWDYVIAQDDDNHIVKEPNRIRPGDES